MPSSARTFVALSIPVLQRTRLGRLQSLIAPELPGARWDDPKMFHLTLAFLGEVPDLDLAPVCRAVNQAVEGFEPFTINLQSLGAFPDAESPRVVWVGVTGPDLDTLLTLQAAIAQAVDGVGYPTDDRFHAHVTIGRLKLGKKAEPVDLVKQVPHFKTWSAGNFEVLEVGTYASTITPEGPAYMSLAAAPLRKRKHG